MSGFVSRLCLLDDEDGIRMQLLEPLVYRSDLLQRDITVETGFTTDFASIPKILWNLLPQHGRYDRGACVHDHLYQHGGVTRAQADAVLLEAMRVCAVPWWQQQVIYWGVRIGGWLVWNAYRRGEPRPTTARP